MRRIFEKDTEVSLSTIFENHPKKTLWGLWLGVFLCLWGGLSIKCIPEEGGDSRKSIRLWLKQKWVGHIIDQNVGRYILLREHSPGLNRPQTPSRTYIAHTNGRLPRQAYPFQTDAHGFILGPTAHKAPDVEILFLGGSTTECLFMPAESRFPYRVGRLIEEAMGIKVNAYNGGVSANESKHSLNVLLNKGVPLKPDIVVFMHNINDLVMLRSQGGYDYLHSLKSHLQTSENLFAFPEIPRPFTPIPDEMILQLFEKNLRLFISICQIHNMIPVLMTQANQVHNDPLYHQMNQRITQVAGSSQVPLVDLALHMDSNEPWLYDPFHLTEQGALKAADLIFERLTPIVKRIILTEG